LSGSFVIEKPSRVFVSAFHQKELAFAAGNQNVMPGFGYDYGLL
jgi:hypothetical protein